MFFQPPDQNGDFVTLLVHGHKEVWTVQETLMKSCYIMTYDDSVTKMERFEVHMTNLLQHAVVNSVIGSWTLLFLPKIR